MARQSGEQERPGTNRLRCRQPNIYIYICVCECRCAWRCSKGEKNWQWSASIRGWEEKKALCFSSVFFSLCLGHRFLACYVNVASLRPSSRMVGHTAWNIGLDPALFVQFNHAWFQPVLARKEKIWKRPVELPIGRDPWLDYVWEFTSFDPDVACWCGIGGAVVIVVFKRAVANRGMRRVSVRIGYQFPRFLSAYHEYTWLSFEYSLFKGTTS